MSEITLNPQRLKESLKSAIVELLQDNREELSLAVKLFYI
ncbi:MULTISPECIES: hypothetical protein [unclassified Microcoleus]